MPRKKNRSRNSSQIEHPCSQQCKINTVEKSNKINEIGGDQSSNKPDWKLLSSILVAALTISVTVLLDSTGPFSIKSKSIQREYSKADPSIIDTSQNVACDNNENRPSCFSDSSNDSLGSNAINRTEQKESVNATSTDHTTYGYDDCTLYLAESTLPNTGLGVFAASDLPQGTPIGPSDIVIQIPELNPHTANGLRVFLWDYAWEGQEAGGQYEGKKVSSVVPGLGMVANGHPKLSQVLHSRPAADDAGLARKSSPGAGAFSHFYNFSFYSRKMIQKGEEIFVDYGQNWFTERETKGTLAEIKSSEVHARADFLAQTANKEEHKRSLKWLHTHGICLDNIQQGVSTNPHAGRGAFATRFLSRGTAIAPAPVIQITRRDSLKTMRIKASNTPNGPDIVEEAHQLLINYCFGHKNSSVLMLPYGPGVNFINHNATYSNAKLRWSTSTQHRGRDWHRTMSLEELKELTHTGLMLEYVATRDILPGEEIFIDYGSEWEEAWQHHISMWKPVPGANSYHPSHELNRIVSNIRTEREQKSHPYPENSFTSCYYSFAVNNHIHARSIRWEKKPGTLISRNLRPCSILERDTTIDGHAAYTVAIHNRFGLLPEERIPKGTMHIVTHVPRHAIEFSDKLYTTDQHLPNAFRHEIGLPEGVFPVQWMDLS